MFFIMHHTSHNVYSIQSIIWIDIIKGEEIILIYNHFSQSNLEYQTGRNKIFIYRANTDNWSSSLVETKHPPSIELLQPLDGQSSR